MVGGQSGSCFTNKNKHICSKRSESLRARVQLQSEHKTPAGNCFSPCQLKNNPTKKWDPDDPTVINQSVELKVFSSTCCWIRLFPQVLSFTAYLVASWNPLQQKVSVFVRKKTQPLHEWVSCVRLINHAGMKPSQQQAQTSRLEAHTCD